MNKNFEKHAEYLKNKIIKLQEFRDIMNDTTEDTLSIDQLIERLSHDLAELKANH